MSMPLQEDKRGGLLGLIVGGIVLFIILLGIVHFTNVHYAGLEGAKPAATAAP
jgi:hypothetical protein